MSAARPVTQLGTAYGGQWITLRYAAELVGLAPDAGVAHFAGLPHRKAAPIPGVAGRRPTMFRLADIERVKQIADACKVAPRIAARIVAAELEGRI